ncbi:sugar phosphate isomerase/epimerase family protein [Pelagibius sp.]|uniref:sugar phosphate isomerase/epimerase family protein n=1 Tax=Pelagibius sp. TaxID=1931238 RepID=UPI003BB040B2
MLDSARIAINQATTRAQWDFRQSVEGYARHGVRGIAVWRDKLGEIGLGEAKRILADHGMQVSGLNRAGPFNASEGRARAAALTDARRAIEEAAELGATCLLLFPGGLPPGSKDIGRTRELLSETIAELLPAARQAGVVLALEPLHPMLAADRSCLNTLSAANDLCDTFGRGLGIVVDIYHVWWDAFLDHEIARAGADRLVGFHVSDWLVPTRDLVFDRGMMGDGIIDIPRIRHAVEAAGYDGPIEVEIFSEQNWWKRNPEEVVQTCIERCQSAV